jgi:arylsulfatase A-like enzyme
MPEKDSEELRHDYVALRDTRWKLVIDRQSDQRELYDLESDPNERNNRYRNDHAAADRLGNELSRLLSKAGESLEAEMTEAEQERVSDHLEDLGYL